MRKARKIPHYRLKNLWVLESILVNLQREFKKHVIVIYLILHLLVLFFSIVQLILFLHFASNIISAIVSLI